jgi:hypothetical protein
MEGELTELVDDGVAGVVPAVSANDDVRVSGEKVDDLSFSLVTPLAAHHGDDRHFSSIVFLLRRGQSHFKWERVYVREAWRAP